MTPSCPLSTIPNSRPLWRTSAAVRARGAAGLVDRVEELDVAVVPGRQPLPADARLEVDHAPLVGALDACRSARRRRLGRRRRRRRLRRHRHRLAAWPEARTRSSSETPSSLTIAYSVRTDGWILPVSIWETRLGETSSRRASSRRLSPRRLALLAECAQLRPTAGVARPRRWSRSACAAVGCGVVSPHRSLELAEHAPRLGERRRQRGRLDRASSRSTSSATSRRRRARPPRSLPPAAASATMQRVALAPFLQLARRPVLARDRCESGRRIGTCAPRRTPGPSPARTRPTDAPRPPRARPRRPSRRRRPLESPSPPPARDRARGDGLRGVYSP